MQYKNLSLLFLGLLFLSCQIPSKNAYILLSDNPQMALVVDLYNSLNPSQTPFIFHYSPEIHLSNLTHEEFDIVIGRNLSRFAPYFKNIHFSSRFLPADYQEILIKYEDFFESSRMIPLAFDLPVILSPSEKALPLFLHLEELNSFKDILLSTKPPFMPFSPFKSKNFLWYWSLLSGLDWHKSTIGDLAWREDALSDFLQSVQKWRKKDFYDSQKAFLEKYAYLGDLNLFKRGYISASFSTLSQWKNYTMDNEALSFSFLTNGQDLMALQEETTYLALSLFANPEEPIKNFKLWLTSFEGQAQIVRELKRKSPYYYGFLNGFSFLREVNLRVIAEEYPELAGRLPDVEHLKLSYPLPFSLPLFLEHIWYPWLENQTSSSDLWPLEQAIKERKDSL